MIRNLRLTPKPSNEDKEVIITHKKADSRKRNNVFENNNSFAETFKHF